MHHHYIDRFAYQDSPIHRLDPRAKVLVVAAYSAVLISLPREVIPSAWFAVLPFVLLVWGGVPLRFVAKHTLIVSPFILHSPRCIAALYRATVALLSGRLHVLYFSASAALSGSKNSFLVVSATGLLQFECDKVTGLSLRH